MVEFKVIDLEEKKKRLIVTVQITDETRMFGFPLSYVNNHVLTDKPQWMHKIKEILERQYELGVKPKVIKNKKIFINHTFKTEDIADLSNKGLLKRRRESEKEKGDLIAEKRLGDKYIIPVPKKKKDSPEDINETDKTGRPVTLKHCEDGTCNSTGKLKVGPTK